MLSVPASPSTLHVLDASSPTDRSAWLQIWHRWPNREVWAHPDYVSLFGRPGDRALCVALEDSFGGILFPLLLRPLESEPWVKESNSWCDLISPYGFGGPFGWGSPDVTTFWDRFDQWADTLNVVSLFTRLPLFEDQAIPFKGEVITKGPSVVIPLEEGEPSILKNYAKSVREVLRRSVRKGVSVVVDPQGDRLEEFLAVYYSTMERRTASSNYFFPQMLFTALMKRLSTHTVFFHALHENHVVSTELQLVSQSHTYAFLGGTTEEGLSCGANTALRHQTNVWGSEQGKRYMVFGGSHQENDGLLSYKKRFAPHSVKTFKVGTRILNPDQYMRLIEQRRVWAVGQGQQWVPVEGFFPAYRS
ncbi:MAG: GNAT family N-acetyltransferase [Nitrospira sp.]|nr:GNAT family N-acetyltransferase [Nitrospira sp.]